MVVMFAAPAWLRVSVASPPSSSAIAFEINHAIRDEEETERDGGARRGGRKAGELQCTVVALLVRFQSSHNEPSPSIDRFTCIGSAHFTLRIKFDPDPGGPTLLGTLGHGRRFTSLSGMLSMNRVEEVQYTSRINVRAEGRYEHGVVCASKSR